MEGAAGADAFRQRACGAHHDRSAHAVSRGAHLAAGINWLLRIQPGHEGLRVGDMRGEAERARVAERILAAGGLSFDGAIEGVDREDGVAGLREALAHGAERGAKAPDVRPY